MTRSRQTEEDRKLVERAFRSCRMPLPEARGSDAPRAESAWADPIGRPACVSPRAAFTRLAAEVEGRIARGLLPPSAARLIRPTPAPPANPPRRPTSTR